MFTISETGWRIKEGQALWRPGRDYPELGGEVVMASHEDGRCVIEFAKTPLPLVVAQMTRKKWLIQFPPRQMSFTGCRARPKRFIWLYLQSALSGESLPAPLQFERKPDGWWRLENTRSGETLEGYFTP